MWQKIRNIFKRNSPETTAAVFEPPVEASPAKEAEEPAERTDLDHISSLLAAILMDAQGDADPESIVAQLRRVADSKSALPESRAFALVGIGETYLQTKNLEDYVKAREAFTELIDSDSKEEAWRIRALVMRALIDGGLNNVTAYNSVLKDLRRVFESPLLGKIEPSYVCRAYYIRGFALQKLGNYSQALSDFQHVLDDPTYETVYRIEVFTCKANIFADQGLLIDELEACLDVIRSDGANGISDVAAHRFDECLYQQNNWDWTIETLNILERREGLTEGERHCILKNRINAYGCRGAKGDIQARIADLTAHLELCRLSSEQRAIAMMERFRDLSQIGEQPTGIEAIELLENVLSAGRNLPDLCTVARSYLGPLYAEQGGEANLNKAVSIWSQQLRSRYLGDEDRAATLLARARVYASFDLVEAVINDCTEVVEMGDRISPEQLEGARQLLAEVRGGRDVASNFDPGDDGSPITDAEVEEKIEIARHHAFSPIGEGPRHALRLLGNLIDHPRISPAARAEALCIRVLIRSSVLEVRDVQQVVRDTSTILDIPEAQPDVVASALNNRAAACSQSRSRQDIDLAIEDFRRIIALPGVADRIVASAYFNLGRLSEFCGDIPQAVDNFERVPDLLPPGDPMVLQARIFRANFFLGLDLYELANEEYTAVLEADHDEVHARSSAFHGRAYVYEGLGDSERALADLEAGLKLRELSEDQKASYLCRHGLAMLDLATPESLIQAEQEFEGVLDLNCDSERWQAIARYGKGMLALDKSDFLYAVQQFSIALNSPELEDKYRVLGLINRSKACRALDDPVFSEMELADYNTLIDGSKFLSEDQLAYVVENRLLLFPDDV